MSKILVLAEKPSVGRDIARVLKCTKKNKSYMEGDKYIVTWAMGHLVTLSAPEKYGEQYKTWNIEHLPIMPSKMKLEVISRTSGQYKTVKTLMNRKDVKEIIIATDAGREGELVARWIIEKAQVKKIIKRLWISSVTDKAIKDGFNNLKPGKAYENLYKAAVARSEADWIIGLNATRALTCKHNAQLSCGRVQTPTISMICAREDEIRNFKAKKYYGIKASVGGINFTYRDSKNNTRNFDEKKVDQLIGSLRNSQAKVLSVSKSSKKKHAPHLYDLTTLQTDANARYGFSAKETLSIMQRLYESHKVLTYPRTDSKHLTADIVPTIKDRLKGCRRGPYGKYANKLLNTTIKGNKSFVDDSKVSDHHAIIPTEEIAFVDDFNDQELKIYDLVVSRFLAVLYPPYQYEQMNVEIKIGNEVFTAQGNSPLALGWKEIYDNYLEDDGEAKDIKFPSLSKGQSINIDKIFKTEGETKAPSYFTEGSLLQAMENPKKYMAGNDKELASALTKTGGLGTVATRADIIEKLFNSGAIDSKGKSIHITSKGRQLLKLVPKDLRSPDLTAEWELKLTSISEGKLNKDVFINDMKSYTKTIINEIKSDSSTFKHDNMTRTKCPECGKFLLNVSNKRGKMLVCQDRECGYKKGTSQITNARCPVCHKKLELRGDGDGRLFVCKCGHKEKLSAFEKRKKESGNKMSNKDAAKFLEQEKKKQAKEIGNSAMADALKNFKLK